MHLFTHIIIRDTVFLNANLTRQILGFLTPLFHMFSTTNCLDNISKNDRNVFVLILRLMQFLRFTHDELNRQGKGDSAKNIWPNCHSSCRALRVHIGDSVEVIDGSILGARHYIVLNGDDESVFTRLDDSIQHSWLKLPDGALVDPFPAGAYAMSPILFPPFGLYHDVFPGSVYISADICPVYANTQEVWRRAENIAHVLAFFPRPQAEMYDVEVRELQQEMQKASVVAADYVSSSDNVLHTL